MKTRHKRLAIAAGVVLVIAAAATLILNAFQSNLVFFFSPTQITTKEAPVNRTFRRLQPFSAAFMAYAHGGNDAQKTMGVITLALVSSGHLSSFTIPLWVKLACALAMALGTYSGGWRIMHTLGSKVIKLDPIHGFAAETSAATVIQIATHFGFPVSTTHTITAAIMGVGATRRLKAVRWGVARTIVYAWVLTLPAAALVAAGVYLVLNLFT